jgi:hypothetical protein
VVVTHESAGAIGKDGGGPPVICPTANRHSQMITGMAARLFALVSRGVSLMDGDLAEALQWASANLAAKTA